jgi:hypothetical protein
VATSIKNCRYQKLKLKEANKMDQPKVEGKSISSFVSIQQAYKNTVIGLTLNLNAQLASLSLLCEKALVRRKANCVIEHQSFGVRAHVPKRERETNVRVDGVVLLSTSREFLATHLLFKRRPSVQTFAFVISNEPPADYCVCLPALFSPLSARSVQHRSSTDADHRGEQSEHLLF